MMLQNYYSPAKEGRKHKMKRREGGTTCQGRKEAQHARILAKESTEKKN